MQRALGVGLKGAQPGQVGSTRGAAWRLRGGRRHRLAAAILGVAAGVWRLQGWLPSEDFVQGGCGDDGEPVPNCGYVHGRVGVFMTTAAWACRANIGARGRASTDIARSIGSGACLGRPGWPLAVMSRSASSVKVRFSGRRPPGPGLAATGRGQPRQPSATPKIDTPRIRNAAPSPRVPEMSHSVHTVSPSTAIRGAPAGRSTPDEGGDG